MLTVVVHLGPRSDCERFGVETINVSLADGEYAESATCTGMATEIEVADVPPGKYQLVVEAVDSDGFVVMDNGKPGEPAEQVEVFESVDREHTSTLAATPAQMFVRWSVAIDGFPSQCVDPGIETKSFATTVWDNSPSVLLEHTFACDAPTDEGSFRRIPDPMREIDGSRVDTLEIQAETDSGVATGDPIIFAFEPPKAGRKLCFTVACDDNDCQGQLSEEEDYLCP